MSEASSFDLETVRRWIGRRETASDCISPRVVKGMNAVLQREASDPIDGEQGPLGLHWCFLLGLVPRVDPLLPLLPSRPRMWAGGETRFMDELRVGDLVRRHSRISTVDLKKGRSGELLFVSIEHEYSTARGLAVADTQNFVYRAPPVANIARAEAGPAPLPGNAKPAGETASDHAKVIGIDAEMLFRYSVLSHNGFRSHYDQEYARTVENNPGLMVHGPLQATLLLDYAQQLRGGEAPASFTHRSQKSLFAGNATLRARLTQEGLDLWASDPYGAVTMNATARWNPR